MTLNAPELVASETELPLGSVAVALLNDKADEPGEAPIFTLTTILATVPFWIAVWFNPKMSTRTRPEEGVDQERIFPADEATPPMVIFCTVKRDESKFTSKLSPVTSVPSFDDRLTGIESPVSPGRPEALPTDKLAPLDCA